PARALWGSCTRGAPVHPRGSRRAGLGRHPPRWREPARDSRLPGARLRSRLGFRRSWPGLAREAVMRIDRGALGGVAIGIDLQPAADLEARDPAAPAGSVLLAPELAQRCVGEGPEGERL